MKRFNELLRGVLPDYVIEQFLDSEFILGASKDCVQPASIDVHLDLNSIYEIDYLYSPRPTETVDTIIMQLSKGNSARKISGKTLLKGKRYAIRLQERLIGLPFFARMNPKSSPGRVFLHSRMLTDGYHAYDEMYPIHQEGKQWLIVTPKCFNITLAEKEPITQLRFFQGNDQLSRKTLEREVSKQPFIMFPSVQDTFLLDAPLGVPIVGDEIASHLLTVDMGCDVVAYKTKKNDDPIDLGKRSADANKYFECISKEQLLDGCLILEEGVGYLLGSYERIKVPEHLAAEVVPFSDKYGELRTHYAGFVDPGFGRNAPQGNSITFEVICNEAGVCLRHRQPIAELKYEYMSSIPKKLYQGNYKLQQTGPQLPKYFAK